MTEKPPLNPANQAARAQLCAGLVEYMDKNTQLPLENLVEQLKANGMSPSWANFLVYNADSEAA